MKAMKEDQFAAMTHREGVATPDPLEESVRAFLRQLGEDPEREGLLRTPQRVARSLRFLTSGYQQDIDKVLNGEIGRAHV
jgi:GTP cyclohydrolase I